MFAKQRHKLRNIVRVHRYYNLLFRRLFCSHIDPQLYLIWIVDSLMYFFYFLQRNVGEAFFDFQYFLDIRRWSLGIWMSILVVWIAYWTLTFILEEFWFFRIFLLGLDEIGGRTLEISAFLPVLCVSAFLSGLLLKFFGVNLNITFCQNVLLWLSVFKEFHPAS